MTVPAPVALATAALVLALVASPNCVLRTIAPSQRWESAKAWCVTLMIGGRP